MAPSSQLIPRSSPNHFWLTVAALALAAALYGARNGATVLAAFQPDQPSDFANYWNGAAAITRGESPFVIAGFNYPPALAFLLAPLGRVRYDTARLIWLALNHLALLAAAVVTWRALGADRSAALAVAAVWALGGTVAENLFLGQVHPILVLLLVPVFFPATVRSFGVPGVVLGVSAALKFWPAAAGLAALLARRFRLLAVAAATSAALLLFPTLAIRFWLDGPIRPVTASFWMGSPALLNASIPGFVLKATSRPRPKEPLPERWVHGEDHHRLRLTGRETALSLGAGASTLLLGIAFIAGACRGRAGAANESLIAGAALLVGLLASPIAWYHYVILLFPAVASLSLGLVRSRQHGRLLVASVAFLCFSWNHIAGVGRYVRAFGFTAAEPSRLWSALAAWPLFGSILFAMFLLEIRRLSSAELTPEGEVIANIASSGRDRLSRN